MYTHHINHSEQIIQVHLTDGDQLRLPLEVKQYLHGIPQGMLEFVLQDGKAYMRPVKKMKSVEELYGSVKPVPNAPELDWKEAERIAKEDRVQHFIDTMNTQ